MKCIYISIFLKKGRGRYLRGATFILLLIFISVVKLTIGQSTSNIRVKTALPSDEEIRSFLIKRIDNMHKATGMVVGIITPEGRKVISYGQLNQDGLRPVNGETVFEIGSVTKIFTALILADMVKKNEIKLDDPVTKYLPKGTKIPAANGRYITLADLATHTSGLPYIPDNMGFDLKKATSYSKEEMNNFSCSYSDQKLYQFLATYQLPRDIGSQWEYSNLDYGLLGKTLAYKAGIGYDPLVAKIITGPLKMKSTSVIVSPDMKKRMGSGHDAQLQITPDICLPAMEAAVAMRSTTNDLLDFLDLFVGDKNSDLSIAAKSMTAITRKAPGFDQALAWFIIPGAPGEHKIVFYGGQTLGYSSSIGYDPETKTGVVVLVNSDQTDGGLGMHLLRRSSPLDTTQVVKETTGHSEIILDQKTLNLYCGQYQSESSGNIKIELRDKNLIMKSATTPPGGIVLHPESTTKFFIKEADLEVEFQAKSNGGTGGLIIHFMGKDYSANKL